MRAYIRPLAISLLSMSLLAGCDQFNLEDKLGLPGRDGDWGLAGTLTLSAASSSLLPNETTDLTVTGGEGPFRFTVSAEDLYLGTKDNPLGTLPEEEVPSASFTAGSAIGRLRVTVENGLGATGETYVTVVPPAPSLVDVHGYKNGSTMYMSFTITPYTSITVDHLTLEYHPTNDQTWNLVSNAIDPVNPVVSNTSLPAVNTYFQLYAVAGAYISEVSSSGIIQPE